MAEINDNAKVNPKHYKIQLKGVVVSNVRAVDPGGAGKPLHVGDVEIEVIDVIETLGFDQDAYVCQALQYLLRLGQKDEARVEVKKAIWYLNRWLTRHP